MKKQIIALLLCVTLSGCVSPPKPNPNAILSGEPKFTLSRSFSKEAGAHFMERQVITAIAGEYLPVGRTAEGVFYLHELGYVLSKHLGIEEKSEGGIFIPTDPGKPARVFHIGHGYGGASILGGVYMPYQYSAETTYTVSSVFILEGLREIIEKK